MHSFVLFGPHADVHFFQGRTNFARCETCGQPTDKWSEDLSQLPLRKLPRHDISYSYDGVCIVSKRFIDIYRSEALLGLDFRPLARGMSWIWPVRAVGLDAESRETLFEEKCEVCGRFCSVAGATPAILNDGTEVGRKEFVRSDLEFGYREAKKPLLICGEDAAVALKKAKLKGLDLEDVLDP